MVALPCLVLKVSIGLASYLTNVTFCRVFSSLMLGYSWYLRPAAFGEQAKTPPQTVMCSC